MAALSGLQSARSLLLFTPIKLYVDCKSLMYLRLSRNTNDQLIRFSIMFSFYDVELFHISSSENYLADIFTKLPTGEEEIEEYMRCLTEGETHKLLKHLTLPDNFKVSSEYLQKLLKEDSVKCVAIQSNREKKKRKKQAVRKDIYPSLKTPKNPSPFKW